MTALSDQQRDPNAGKYHLLYAKEFELARHVLEPLGGVLEWSNHDYIAFTYTNVGVCIIFYPHTVKGTGNRHLRVRDGGSKHKEEALNRMRQLDRAAGFNCTFTMKHGRARL